MMKLMRDGGTSSIEVEAEEGVQSLRNADDWWIIALGSGLRWTIDQTSAAESETVRCKNADWIEQNNISEIGTNVIYAVAQKTS